MTAPSYVTYVTATGTSTTPSCTLPTTSMRHGDLIFYCAHTSQSWTFTAPTGFTELVQTNGYSPGPQPGSYQVAAKLYEAGVDEVITGGMSFNYEWEVFLVIFRNAAFGTSVQGDQSGSEGTIWVLSPNNVLSNVLVFYFWGARWYSAGGSDQADTWVVPAGMTELFTSKVLSVRDPCGAAYEVVSGIADIPARTTTISFGTGVWRGDGTRTVGMYEANPVVPTLGGASKDTLHIHPEKIVVPELPYQLHTRMT